MYSSYVPGFSSYLENTLLGGEQGLPSEQPVEAEPYVEPIDLGGWNLANFQNQFMQPGGGGALADYIGQQAALGNNYVSPLTDTNVMMPGMASNLLNLYGETPEEQALRYYNLESRDTTTPITFDPRTYSGGYQLVDTSGKVLGTASSADQLQALIQQAGGLQGAGDAYSVQGLRGSGETDTIFQQNKDAGTFGSLILPMATIAALALGAGALTGGIGGAGGAAGAAGAGGAGAGASSLGGALAASTAGGISAGTAAGVGAGLGGLAAAAPAFGGITVLAPTAGLSLGTAAGLAGGAAALGGLSTLGGTSAAPGATNYGDQLWNQPGYADAPITVVGNTAPAVGPGVIAGAAPIAAAPALGGAQTTPAQPVQAEPVPEEIVVNAPVNNPPVVSSGLSLGDIATLGGATSLLPTITPNVPMTDIPAAETGGGLSMSNIVDYLQLASLGVGTLGSLFGGGGDKQGSGKWPGGAAPNPVFGSTLPSANLPGLTNGGGAPRTADELGGQGLRTNQDWYRYGYGPQQSFFKHVQQGAPNTSQAFTGYAMGGTVVEGAGDGREDKIPAMLSDGEYVIDAETVALLGNGSNKAGADLLDQFRVNVRKHKGRELSRGNFSEDAMRPEHYLAGGLA